MSVSKDVVYANEANKQIHESDNAFNAQQAELNRQFQAEQTEKQNQWNLDLWNKNNEYNTPQNQVDRLVAAGINPNMYGSISSGTSSSTASSSSTPSGSQASAGSPIAMQPTDSFRKTLQLVDTLVNGGTGIAKAFFQDSSLSANTRQANAQARLTNANAEAQEIQNNISRSYDAGLATAGLYFNSNTADFINQQDYDALDDLQKRDYQLVTGNGTNKGTGQNTGIMKAAQAISTMFKDVNQNKASSLQAKLAATIFGKQIQDPDVINGLVKMPAKQFDELCGSLARITKELKLLDDEHDLNEDAHKLNEKQLDYIQAQMRNSQNSSMANFISHLVDKGNITWQDALIGLCVAFDSWAGSSHATINWKTNTANHIDHSSHESSHSNIQNQQINSMGRNNTYN